MINRYCHYIILIFSIFIALIAGEFLSNKNILNNIKYGLETQIVNQSDLEFTNWKTEGSSLISQSDPWIVIRNINRFVHNIKINGSISNSKITPQIFYSKDGNFTEENSIFAPIDEDGRDIYINIDKKISDLRIDLINEPEFRLELNQITINPRSFIFTYKTILYSFLCFLIIFTPLYYVYIYKKSRVIIDLKNYNHLLKNLVLRDIKVKYRRSILGILWSVLNPLLMMLVITAVFQNLFKFNIDNFPVYYLAGSLIFNFVTEATSNSMTSIIYAGPLIKKVYVPKYIFPIEKCVFALINMLFSFIATIFVIIILKFPIPFTIILVPLPVLYTFIFSLGLGMLLSTVNVFFRDMGHLYGVWTTAWFYLSPIIYPLDILPKTVLNLVKLNPLYYYIEYFRQVIMYNRMPDLYFNIICIGSALLFLWLGLLVFNKKQDAFILFI